MFKPWRIQSLGCEVGANAEQSLGVQFREGFLNFFFCSSWISVSLKMLVVEIKRIRFFSSIFSISSVVSADSLYQWLRWGMMLLFFQTQPSKAFSSWKTANEEKIPPMGNYLAVFRLNYLVYWKALRVCLNKKEWTVWKTQLVKLQHPLM